MPGQRELGTSTRTDCPEKCRLSAFKPLIVSTYNVRTLFQHGKTHQLFMGCTDAGKDIAGIQEHRLITTTQQRRYGLTIKTGCLFTAQPQTRDKVALEYLCQGKCTSVCKV